ncbi:4Fe-4S dicluster domain-containing protein [Faecalimicrobium sp. JNUCC 81]
MEKCISSFVVADYSKCIGCRACEVACFVSHNKNNNIGFTVGTVEVPIIPRLYLVKDKHSCIPIQCRHCEDAPCLNSCINGAIKKENNIMFIDEDLCVGCKTCMLACPIGAIDLQSQYKEGKKVEQINLDDGKKIAYKCDLCRDSEKIACINACPNKALKLIDPIDDKKQKNKKAAISLLMTKN